MNSNLATMPSKLLPISTEHGKRDPNMIGQYEGSSENTLVKVRALKMKKVKDEIAVLTTNNCKQLLSKIFVKV